MESMPSQPLHLMNPMTSKFIPTLPFHLGCLRMNPLQLSKLFQLCASSSSTIVTTNAPEVITEQNSRNGRTAKGVRGSKGISEAQFKEDWLHSSSSPFAHPKLSLNSAFKLFSASSSATIITTDNPEVITEPNPEPSRNGRAAKVVRGSKGILEAQLKEDWLHSLSCPFVHTNPPLNSGWVIGVDPDASGALALLKPDQSAQVFDSPQLKVLVGKGLRKRLDAKSIVQLLQSFEAPIGTTAYIERSTPYPQDGKQGWWGGGFGYGMWIGILVASGFSVIPVSSNAWKNEFQLTKERSNKDCSREVASALFPSLSSLLKRKKDHGRAEALLIAAYGKGLKINSDSFCTAETEVPLTL